jgi:hypothetical protein
MLVLLLVLPRSAAAGAQFFILNVNIGPTGFNDPTPVEPVGGNTGRTLGKQRLGVFERATALWGSRIDSDIQIVVQSQMNPLFCAGGAATLGTAAAFTAVRDFDGAPLANTWYHVALARALAGEDLSAGYPDMFAVFSTSIDTGCIPGIDGWYYGLDGNPPPGTIELLPIVLHELAHGLGFANLTREEDGSFFQGVPDIYTRFTFDHIAGQTWADMATDGERAASALRCGQVSWNGPRVTVEAVNFLAPGAPVLTIEQPATIAGDLTLAPARFGPPLSAEGVSGSVVVADDGSGTVSDGCEGPATTGTPWFNAAAVAGNIALIDRGTCSFTDKVRNAQDSGAVGVVVADNGPSCPPFDLTGEDPAVAIPSGRITRADGNLIRAQIPAVVARLAVDPTRLAGTFGNTGQVLLFATDPLIPGSAISHFDTSPFPDLLMEPFANLAGREIDLTFPFLRELGWARMRSLLEIPALDWRGLATLALVLLASGLWLMRRAG